MNTYEQDTDFLNKIKPVILKHNGKVFGKRLENDLKKIDSKFYIKYIGCMVQYICLSENQFSVTCNPLVDAAKSLSDLQKRIDYNLIAGEKLDDESKNINKYHKKFEQLSKLINELDKLSYELKDQLKKQHGVSFSPYYRG